AVFGNAPVLDPVGVGRETRDLLVFYADLEEPDGRRVVRVVDDFRIIFLLFQGLLVGAGILFHAEDNCVFVQPFKLARRAGKFGKRVGFAAPRTDQPNLRRRRVWLGLWPRLSADKGDPLSVGRPTRHAAVVSAARQLYFAVFGEAGEKEIGDSGILLLVAVTFRPDQPVAVGGNVKVADGLVVDNVFGFPWLGFCRFGFVGGEKRRSNRENDGKKNNWAESIGMHEPHLTGG